MKGMGVRVGFVIIGFYIYVCDTHWALQSGFVKGYKIKALSLIMLICYE
jgi:uncharacterized membrane protein YwzB